MSLHFVPLKIMEVRKETPDCVSILFHVPDDLASKFVFTQGQNITVRTNDQSGEVRRSYSICSAPHENELRVAVKRVEGGLFSNLANHRLKAGDTLEVLPPTGKFFTSLHSGNKKRYLAIAAGSGITPVISIIKTTLKSEPHSTFTLMYGNRSRSSIIFFEELEGLKNKYVDRFQLIHILSREKTDVPVNFGRIDVNKCATLAKIIPFSMMDEIFLCGPEEMIFSIKRWLEESGIDKRKIHFELFNTPGEQRMRAADRASQGTNRGQQSVVTVKLDGITFDFNLASEGTSILDAALQKGADLPFSCKGGVCGTCRAKLIEGEVQMDTHWALEDDEVAKGFILTCQSHPKTDKVVIDYDSR